MGDIKDWDCINKQWVDRKMSGEVFRGKEISGEVLRIKEEGGIMILTAQILWQLTLPLVMSVEQQFLSLVPFAKV